LNFITTTNSPNGMTRTCYLTTVKHTYRLSACRVESKRATCNNVGVLLNRAVVRDSALLAETRDFASQPTY
jgi:hypothetical protein